MASATCRKTGKGVAQSLRSLVRIGAATTVLNDLTVIATLGRRAPPAGGGEWSDRAADGVAVTDIAGFRLRSRNVWGRQKSCSNRLVE